METLGRGTKTTEIMEKCLFLKTTGGATRQRVVTELRELESLGLIKKDRGGAVYPDLKQKISSHLLLFNATQEEIDSVYNHVLAMAIEGNKQ
jgi:hypothetical protein